MTRRHLKSNPSAPSLSAVPSTIHHRLGIACRLFRTRHYRGRYKRQFRSSVTFSGRFGTLRMILAWYASYWLLAALSPRAYTAWFHVNLYDPAIYRHLVDSIILLQCGATLTTFNGRLQEPTRHAAPLSSSQLVDPFSPIVHLWRYSFVVHRGHGST